MKEIFADIIDPIEETFIESRNGLHNGIIAQRCKSVGNEKNLEEEAEDEGGSIFSSGIAELFARERAWAKKEADKIRGLDTPKTIAVTNRQRKDRSGGKAA